MRITGFAVRGYKGLVKEVALSDLGPVNVLHGENSVGKSSVLEAMLLFFRLLPLMLPLGKPRELQPNDFENQTGFRAQDVFHFRLRQPIGLRATIEIEAGELEGHEIHPLRPTSPIEIALELGQRDWDVVAHVKRFRFSDASDAIEDFQHAPHAEFIKSLVRFLTTKRSFRDRVERPRFALIDELRRVRGEAAQAQATPRLVPPELRQRLIEARDSLDGESIARWKLFAQTVERLVPRLLPEDKVGEIGARWDRAAPLGTADVYWDTGGWRIPVDLLGSGVQQIIALIGHVLTTDATFVAIEEPELNLRHALQLQVAEALRAIAADPRGPSQFFLSSHSAAFERPDDHFYGMSIRDGAPVVVRAPARDVRAYLGSDATVPPGTTAPLSYVTSEGLVLVPEHVRQQLGLQSGGGVAFVTSPTGHVEMLTNNQLLESLGEDGDAERE